jgi:hypothetical protein
MPRTLTFAAALLTAVAVAAPSASAATTAPARAKKAKPLTSLTEAKRKQVRRVVARRASSRRFRSFTEQFWYDWFQGSYRVGTSASGIELQGTTYITVWNPIVKTINGLTSQGVTFRALVYNPNNGAAAVSDWWGGTSRNYGSYTGGGYLGGYVYNQRTGARLNGDGGLTFSGPGYGYWAYLEVRWHSSSGAVQRSVGFWLN